MFSRNIQNSPPSNLPTEFVIEITEVFNTQFKDFLDDKESFQASARIYNSEVTFILVLSKPTNTKNYNIYASTDYYKDKTPINEAIYHLVDSIGCFLEEFFKSNREVFLPQDWTKYEINNKTIYLKGDTKNLALDSISDSILEKA